MEEQQERRNVGEKEGGQPSRNSGETGPEPKEHRIDIVEINPTVKNWNRFVQKAIESTQSRSHWPRIPKVPQMLKGTKDFKKFYEPRVISLGPYHYGKPHLRQGEMIKPLYAQKFLADSNQDIDALYKKIKSNIEAVRKCYDSRPTKRYDDEALTWMMLLDGCFLLQFICGTGMKNFLRYHQIGFVELDLFLLENQLPFGVLKLIFEGTSLPLEETIKEFITNTIRPEGSTSEIQLKEEKKEPSHLLDLLRSAFLGKKQQAEEKGESSSSRGRDGGFCCPWKNWPSFRHIKELKAAGIHLQLDRTISLRDISFNPSFFYGYLKLPPIMVDDFTKPKFLNMVAYEMCPDAPDDYAVTSYVCFLYDLIDDADDVKELRSKHILYNCLGSDEDVAKIFNEIGNDLIDPDAYKKVKTRIQKHYDKRVNTWIAEALHEHFRSPWTIIALIAAVLILLFTGVSTYYALPGKSSYRVSDLLRSSR